MLVSKHGSLLTLLILTASACFIIGAYWQHWIVERNLRKLIGNDPYAFYLRRQLYELLSVFPTSEDWNHSTRMHEIMKYGFPGLDDLHFYKDFMLSYDRRNRVAHWVCEHLKTESITMNPRVKRKRAEYTPDMSVPSNFRSNNDDYARSGYDRGHLAAAGNHKLSQTHCNETFYLTNIAPQVGKGFNRDAWNQLEIYVRQLTERYGSVYVYTGPLYLASRQDGNEQNKLVVEYEVIGRNAIAVPTHFFKVIAIESQLDAGRPYLEAYLLPNKPLPKILNLRNFLCDIRTIERYAGLKFFESLRSSYFFGINYSETSRLFRSFS